MKKLISFLLCVLLLCGSTTPALASQFQIDLGQTWDDGIFAGGILDMYAWVGGNSEDYTFQWQVDVSIGDGSWSDLEDNADPYGYAGTDTYHLQFITPRTNSYILGTGWEDIPFRCVVTHKKTGVKRSTPNLFMRVFTSDELEEYMAKKGVRLYEPSKISSAAVTTTDDKTYYTTAEAGNVLKFTCGYQPPQNDPLMGRSDMVGKVEVWITEDGKTVKRDNGGSYTPYTIGKDTVTVQYKLRYSLGVHDLGYYETKTLKLSTTAPKVVGRGTARQSISLLKEPYGQSQKLTTIPQNATVLIHKNSGSWYQVSYNNYIGYVSGSSLNWENYTPEIERVEVTIAEPLAGQLPPASATVAPAGCDVTSVEWLDKTLDRFMTPGERFVKGHDYQLVLWITAKEGYSFLLDSSENVKTTAIINKDLPAFVSQAYEQIRGKVIDVRYDFNNLKEAEPEHTCVTALVAKVPPTCEKEGFRAYYKCSCGKVYADPAATQPVDLNVWGVLPATGHKEGAFQSTGTHHYKKCTVCQKEIPGSNAPHSGGTATCLEKAICTQCNTPYGQTDDHLWSPKYHPVDAGGHAWQCAHCKCYDTALPHTPGPEATETQSQTCTQCGYIIAPAKNHTHTPIKVSAKAPTCLTPGNVEYYTCSGCSQWWLDRAMTKPVEKPADVQLPATGHKTSQQWSFDDEAHFRSCIFCMTPMEDSRSAHQLLDGKCSVCLWGSAPTLPTEQASTAPQQTREGSSFIERFAFLIPVLCLAVVVVALLLVLRKKKPE